ncbi:hypothetical protein MYX65_12440, partial [Acidobacteria bacterium AH-259-L09]|nr:hypothetical protein [Acidobacteria bacterium AH-259-L09]
SWVIAATFSLLLCGPRMLWAKEPCSDEEIQSPQPPQMIEADLALVRGGPDQGALPEWSKIEKLRNFYKRHAANQAPCSIIEGEEIAVRLFVARPSLEEEGADQMAGRFAAEKAFQFYGASRVKVERVDKEVTREYAFPIAGPAKIADVAEAGQLDVMLEDLAQLQLVTVPRFRHHKVVGASSENQTEDCFLVSNVTVVPSRVFDEPLPSETSESPQVQLTLNARRHALEHVVREARWLQRLDTEEPGCRASEVEGYLSRQIRSLNLTVRELVPDIDFVAQSIGFWQEVEQRIEQLRAEDEGWKKEITKGEKPR